MRMNESITVVFTDEKYPICKAFKASSKSLGGYSKVGRALIEIYMNDDMLKRRVFEFLQAKTEGAQL